MDEQQPGADEPFDDEVYVRAWWQRHRHQHAPVGRDPEAARALDWAAGGVDSMVLRGDPESAVTLVHRLLHAPGADPEAVAGMPLHDLLAQRGTEVEKDVAESCAEDAVWREAVGMVALTDEQRAAAVPALAPYLR